MSIVFAKTIPFKTCDTRVRSKMKIRKDTRGKLTVQFDASWEQIYLIALQDTGKHWASLYLAGKAEAIGRVHTKTHQVQLQEEQGMVNELDVVLKES